MLRHIGLLMVRNEVDVLAEALEAHSRFFDTIVAQDGSTDGGRELIAACPNVIKLFRDEDVLREGERWTDGHRNHAMQWILSEFGCADVWVTLLHADEFWWDDPLEMAEQADAGGATFVMWGEFRFFLHHEDRFTLDLTKPVTERVTWWGGPFFEDRQFKLENHQLYFPGTDHCTIPRGPGQARRWKARIPRYRHYPYRSKAQCLAVWIDKVQSRYWQPDHAWLHSACFEPWLRALPMPKNSPLAAWDHVEKFAGTLPDPQAFLPTWWEG